MKLGTSTCLFSSKRNGQRTSIIDCLDMIRECGFDVADANFCSVGNPKSGAELCGDDWEAQAYAIRDHAEKIGMKITQSHIPYNAGIAILERQLTPEGREWFDEATRRSIIASGILGVKWIVAHALTDTIHDEWAIEQNIKCNDEFFAPQIELAKKCGCGFAIENMAEFDPAKTKRRFTAVVEEQIAIIDHFNDPQVGGCWDFGHAQMVYRDQSAALRKLGSRLRATHVQENPGNADSHLIPFVGGRTKWEVLMPLLAEIGYTGDFVYECHGFMHSVPEELRISAGKFSCEVGRYCMKLYESAAR